MGHPNTGPGGGGPRPDPFQETVTQGWVLATDLSGTGRPSCALPTGGATCQLLPAASSYSGVCLSVAGVSPNPGPKEKPLLTRWGWGHGDQGAWGTKSVGAKGQTASTVGRGARGWGLQPREAATDHNPNWGVWVCPTQTRTLGRLVCFPSLHTGTVVERQGTTRLTPRLLSGEAPATTLVPVQAARPDCECHGGLHHTSQA